MREQAALIGVTPAVLSGAETGRVPQRENAEKIARFYELDQYELWPWVDAEQQIVSLAD